MDDIRTDQHRRDAAADAIRARLESLRESIHRELCTFPTPIPGCDVSFNRLLEERARVVDELQRLTKLAAAPFTATALIDYLNQSESLEAEFKARIIGDLRSN